MKILRVEPFSGVSGDMFLGALLDLGAPAELLIGLPARLGLDGARVEIAAVDKKGIRCPHVVIHDETEPVPRHLPDILAIIDGADLPRPAAELAARIFHIVGEAEAAVHGVPVAKVHFHEVGAIDSILDVVGAALLLNEFEFDRVVSDPVTVGSGWVDCAHGRMPVPAPATARILQGVPTQTGPVAKEMTTPTGAAILKALEPRFSPEFEAQALRIEKTGYGAGTRDLEQPNCLRLSLGATVEGGGPETVLLIQSNLDDVSGELLGGHFQDRLLQAGALDVNLCPLLMKKGRPGHRLEVLCRARDREALAGIILGATSTIGLRWWPVERAELPRRIETVTTRYGEVRVKCVTLPEGRERCAPEFEDCLARAREAGVEVQEVMNETLRRCCD